MKKNVFLVIIGILIGATFGVYGTMNYHAKDISFNSNNIEWNVDNVEDAVNDLYEKTKKDFELELKISATLLYNSGSNYPQLSYGTATRNITVKCIKGEITIANNDSNIGGIHTNASWNNNYSTGVRIEKVEIISFNYI